MPSCSPSVRHGALRLPLRPPEAQRPPGALVRGPRKRSEPQPLPWRQRSPSHAGFALVELIIAVSLSALIALYASGRLAHEAQESLAEGSGQYLRVVAAAVEQHVLLNFSEYASGSDVAGVALDLQPTLAEIVALGRLNAGFPAGPGAMPTQQSARIDISRSNCPGSGCTLTTLVCTTAPVTLGGADVRFDLAATMVASQGGSGGQALPGFASRIRGPTLDVPNPVGAVEGIVCGSATVDTALFQKFLTLNDLRDPNFQGPMTVAGPVTVAKRLSVAGATGVGGNMSVGGCLRMMAASGRVGITCLNPDDLPAGWSGGLRTVDVVAGGTVLVSDSPAAFTGANTAYALLAPGEVRTSGRAQADRLVPTGTYALGGTCAAAEEGAIARATTSGLVTCRTSSWRALIAFASVDSACAPDGALADDGTGAKLLCVAGRYFSLASLHRLGTPGAACGNAGAVAYDPAGNDEMLLCRINPAGGAARYMRLRDLTSHLQFVQSYEVADYAYGGAGLVTKPACASAAGMSATPLIQLVPKALSTADGGISLYATDNGSTWSIVLRQGNGALLSGSPNARAIAHVYCFFA